MCWLALENHSEPERLHLAYFNTKGVAEASELAGLGGLILGVLCAFLWVTLPDEDKGVWARTRGAPTGLARGVALTAWEEGPGTHKGCPYGVYEGYPVGGVGGDGHPQGVPLRG